MSDGTVERVRQSALRAMLACCVAMAGVCGAQPSRVLDDLANDQGIASTQRLLIEVPAHELVPILDRALRDDPRFREGRARAAAYGLIGQARFEDHAHFITDGLQLERLLSGLGERDAAWVCLNALARVSPQHYEQVLIAARATLEFDDPELLTHLMMLVGRFGVRDGVIAEFSEKAVFDQASLREGLVERLSEAWGKSPFGGSTRVPGEETRGERLRAAAVWARLAMGYVGTDGARYGTLDETSQASAARGLMMLYLPRDDHRAFLASEEGALRALDFLATHFLGRREDLLASEGWALGLGSLLRSCRETPGDHAAVAQRAKEVWTALAAVSGDQRIIDFVGEVIRDDERGELKRE